MNIEADYRQLRRQHQEVLRYLAVLVERAGGEVLLLATDLAEDRQLSKDDGPLGTVRLTAKRP
jgi:hypothetical protein